MYQELAFHKRPRSVGIQCQLWCTKETAFEPECKLAYGQGHDSAYGSEYKLDYEPEYEPEYKAEYELPYVPDARTSFCRSDTLIIEDTVNPWPNKIKPALNIEKCRSIDLQEDKLDDLLENWWNGSFSIPGPPSLTSDDDEQEEKETKKDNLNTIERGDNTVDIDYEDLFRRLMNINIHAVAEYMANEEPFCLSDHIVNCCILFAILLAVHFIW